MKKTIITTPSILQTIAKDIETIGGKAILVGGCVRDAFLGKSSKDYDVEVYGLESLDRLEEILQRYGSVNLVGKSFGVLKFVYDGDEYDFSFPRKESKVSAGHRGFEINSDGFLSYDEAFKRRDFTINAMGYDILSSKMIDPFGGMDDLKAKRVKHIDDKTFVEDPLRVYRGVQFCARFEFEMDSSTKKLCQSMLRDGMLDELPKERVYEEFKKLLLKSLKPSIGFELMRELGVIESCFPELNAIIGVVQSPKYHPEGDVWVHTMMCIDKMALILHNEYPNSSEKFKLRMMFAILCHDLGKATHTTIEDDGTIRSIGHERAGVEPTREFLYRLTNEHDFIKSILPLVEHHLKPSQFYSAKSKAGAIRRLSTKVNIQELVLVAKADFLGRDTIEAKNGVYKAGEWLLERSKELSVDTKPPKPLLQGRDLISLGLEPSPKFKKILDSVYDKQLAGDITTKAEALEYAKNFFC